MDMFKQLFIKSDQMPHLFLSDVNRIITSMQKDFPEIIKVYSMGQTFEERPIQVVELDAKAFLTSTDKPKDTNLLQYDFYSDNNEPEVKHTDSLAESLRDQVKQLRIKPLGETDDDSTLLMIDSDESQEMEEKQSIALEEQIDQDLKQDQDIDDELEEDEEETHHHKKHPKKHATHHKKHHQKKHSKHESKKLHQNHKGHKEHHKKHSSADSVSKNSTNSTRVQSTNSLNSTANATIKSNESVQTNSSFSFPNLTNSMLHSQKNSSNATVVEASKPTTTKPAAKHHKNKKDHKKIKPKKKDEFRPSILLTGATHSRELITIQMVLFELVKLVQNGIIN